jgi:hypothetical protein
MRVLVLVLLALVILALGGLEVLASRLVPIGDPLPSVSAPWH